MAEELSDFVDIVDLTERQRELLKSVVAQAIQARVHAKRQEIIRERDELLDLARILKDVTGISH